MVWLVTRKSREDAWRKFGPKVAGTFNNADGVVPEMATWWTEGGGRVDEECWGEKVENRGAAVTGVGLGKYTLVDVCWNSGLGCQANVLQTPSLNDSCEIDGGGY